MSHKSPFQYSANVGNGKCGLVNGQLIIGVFTILFQPWKRMNTDDWLNVHTPVWEVMP